MGSRPRRYAEIAFPSSYGTGRRRADTRRTNSTCFTGEREVRTDLGFAERQRTPQLHRDHDRRRSFKCHGKHVIPHVNRVCGSLRFHLRFLMETTQNMESCFYASLTPFRGRIRYPSSESNVLTLKCDRPWLACLNGVALELYRRLLTPTMPAQLTDTRSALP
jgi:hypothetical protein